MSEVPPPTQAHREGSLDAPTRHPIAWRDEAYYDMAAVEAEMERVFDICHTCRRCFNLCDSFRRLFDMIDEAPTGEVDGVLKSKYRDVVDACTLCDMCFMTKCPYVPPHPWDVDFAHLMLRHRAAERRHTGRQWLRDQFGETDRNGRMAKPVAPLVNWATDRKNQPIRELMEMAAGIDHEVELPKWHSKTAVDLGRTPAPVNPDGPALGRKAVIYATCFSNYNDPQTAVDAMSVLALQGVETRMMHPVCCGMPQLEAGDIAEVASRAERVAAEFGRWIADGWDVVALTASCGLMLKFEWPLILPESEAVKTLSGATYDISEYVVELSKQHGLLPGLKPLQGGVVVHHACHARAQNMGQKSAELLRLIPDTKVDVVERCSGHGGTFGVMKRTHGVAVKVGKPAARQVAKTGDASLCSDCPLACKHLGQLLEAELAAEAQPRRGHPIQMFARAYGL